MRKVATTAAMVTAALLMASGAYGQGLPDISGTWTVDISTVLSGETSSCLYQGNVPLIQNGSAVTGPADLMLTSGPASCPVELSGSFNGTLSVGGMGQVLVDGVIDGIDPAGHANVSGTFSSSAMATASMIPLPAVFQEPSDGSGDFDVDEGSFAGITGTWSAVPAAPVPALNPVALTVLVLLLLAAGALALRRREVIPTRS